MVIRNLFIHLPSATKSPSTFVFCKHYLHHYFLILICKCKFCNKSSDVKDVENVFSIIFFWKDIRIYFKNV